MATVPHETSSRRELGDRDGGIGILVLASMLSVAGFVTVWVTCGARPGGGSPVLRAAVCAAIGLAAMWLPVWAERVAPQTLSSDRFGGHASGLVLAGVMDLVLLGQLSAPA